MPLEQVKYINHLDEVLNFGQDRLFINQNTLHDYEWDLITQGDKIRGFSRKIHTFILPICVIAASAADGQKTWRKLYEIPEKDVRNNTPGWLSVGRWYVPCYITASEKTSYDAETQHYKITLTVTTDAPFWIREYVSGDNYGKHNPSSGTITAPIPFDFNFRLTMYGPATDMWFFIGRTWRHIVETITEDECVVVDTRTQEVYKQSAEETGPKTDLFSKRDKRYWIFDKVPYVQSGEYRYQANGMNSFTLLLYSEYSQPGNVFTVNGDDAEEMLGRWKYVREGENVIELGYVGTRPSGIDLVFGNVQGNAHLFEDVSETFVANKETTYFAMEDGRLIAYHD